MKEFIAFIGGAWVSLALVIIILKITQVNISEAELLRFCMDKNIKRAECLIPKESL